MYERAHPKRQTLKRAISQRRLTKEEREHREDVDVGDMVAERNVLDARQEMEGIKEEAKKQWEMYFYEKSSRDIQHLIKDKEAIPHIQREVKAVLEAKEKEFIKRRNTQLFKVKVLEQQLADLTKAYKTLQLQTRTQGEEKMEQMEKEI